jgi:hypothetical protein
MKWNEEQLDILSEVYKATLKPVVIHCEDWDDEIRVRKYMADNHPVVDFEVRIDEQIYRK